MARSTSIRPMLPKPAVLEGLESGSHNFKFDFNLPKHDQYTSFDAKGAAGCVRYYVLLQATREGMTVFKKKQLFPVVVPVHLDQDVRSCETPEAVESCTFAKGTVTARMSLKKRGFVPGEPIEGNISIKNGSKESIKVAFLRIVQNTDSVSKRPEVEIKTTAFETSGVGLPIHKILPGEDYSYPIGFHIPAIVPNFEIPACLKIDYSLVLTVGRDRNHITKGFLNLKIPILIGTHPVTVDRLMENIKDENYGSDVSSAPPAYSELGLNPGPIAHLPSYSEAIGGRSEINDDDDVTDYAPLLYQYNCKFYINESFT